MARGSQAFPLGGEGARWGKAGLCFKSSVTQSRKRLGVLYSLFSFLLTTLFMMLDFIAGLLQYFLFVCYSENLGCVGERQEHGQRSGWMAGRDRGAGKYACKEYICMRWWYLAWEGKRKCSLGDNVGLQIVITVARRCWTCGKYYYLKISPHAYWFCLSFNFFSAMESNSYGVQRK